MVNNNQQSQIMIIEKHKAKQFIFLDYKFDHRLKRRLATRRNLLPKFCGRWEAICCRGITAAWRLTRSAVRFHFWFQTQHFHSWTTSASHFFWHVLPLRPSAGHQGFYMLIPGVLPDISALIPEIVAGNPELSSTSQQVPIFFMV